MASPAVKELINLAAQLCVSAPASKNTDDDDDDDDDRASLGASLLARDDEDDCDFSSFPSLSLQESPGNFHRGIFTSRGDVESHVESLLSRPILLGKQEDLAEDPDSDSLDEFVVENLNEVPKLMLSNFCASFSTLMNSRLRAYASFLARHALTLASEHEDEGVVGIEQKLETMLGIGSQITVTAVSSELKTEIRLEQKPEEATVEDNMTYQESLPVTMEICIQISLPHARQGGGSESMTASFQSSGKICGKFKVAISFDPQRATLALQYRMSHPNICIRVCLSSCHQASSRRRKTRFFGLLRSALTCTSF